MRKNQFINKKGIVAEFNCDNPFLHGSYIEILRKFIISVSIIKFPWQHENGTYKKSFIEFALS